ncbi:MAG: nitrogenase cofactor biosynthesis protein NifB [Firmicutes bacterium]|nr:nitrogenase cofactor biosynthesis protein NifB [Bacillota bacterium]
MKCLCKSSQDNGGAINPRELEDKTGRHPCFSFEAHKRYARMHLPVAPRCNISCNYCSRKYDCVNESRPGVTSEILTPAQALQKYIMVSKKVENLSVVGIAGPGDALANWGKTRKTLELIRGRDPEVVFCLSTNGLLLPDYAGELVELGVSHVTVTVNCLDPAIGQGIYRYVDYRGQRYEGLAGAAILIASQLEGINYLARRGVLVNVNIVMIKGVNDFHIPDIVKRLKDMNVFISNIMPLIPARGSVFENYPGTGVKELNQMRAACGTDLRQMYHCRQCRADAIGLLDNDRSAEFRTAHEDGGPPGKGAACRRARAV